MDHADSQCDRYGYDNQIEYQYNGNGYSQTGSQYGG